jgi:coenzyme F420 hydrogenase subunit delta
MYPEIVIAGCGNILYADDGFGPAVAEELRNCRLPDNVQALDAGTSAPHYLFPMLDPAITKRLIILDAVDFGGCPGSIILFRPGDFSRDGIHDAHYGGILSGLHTIRDRMDVLIIGCQPERVSDR